MKTVRTETGTTVRHPEPGDIVTLTHYGAARVLDGRIGMQFKVYEVTAVDVKRPTVHVRDFRYDNNGIGYQTWSIGYDGYVVTNAPRKDERAGCKWCGHGDRTDRGGLEWFPDLFTSPGWWHPGCYERHCDVERKRKARPPRRARKTEPAPSGTEWFHADPVLKDAVEGIAENGPTRILCQDGSGKSPSRLTPGENAELAGRFVVFVRNDGWSLGSGAHMEAEAFRMWKAEWTAFIVRGEFGNLPRPISEYRGT